MQDQRVRVRHVAKLTLSIVVMACSCPEAFGADGEFIYCQLRAQDAVYYSDVFQGDYMQKPTIERAFSDHVQGSYGAHGYTSCLFTKDLHDSRAAQDHERATGRSTYGKIVDTHWTY